MPTTIILSDTDVERIDIIRDSNSTAWSSGVEYIIKDDNGDVISQAGSVKSSSDLSLDSKTTFDNFVTDITAQVRTEQGY
jgi:hypothetical protein